MYIYTYNLTKIYFRQINHIWSAPIGTAAASRQLHTATAAATGKPTGKPPLIPKKHCLCRYMINVHIYRNVNIDVWDISLLLVTILGVIL